ncbi:HAD family phosphatase [Sphaerisporangium album]|uniref:HAD family phosphatase n=1 Tax=Sphaerisporangium album TaxID=509200 RepID=A0A367FDH5_9ACTN|nr:HAD family phosphatase [Sphaerisporangium album]RCG27969.1 HAD family phosphatase [Sphaerisporangium album]
MVKGVLIDWGGVLTTGLHEAITEWLTADGIDAAHYRDLMRDLVAHAYEGGADGENPIHALERGEVDAATFERDLAARLLTLDGGPPVAEGLLARMFAGFRPVEPMYEMLRAARASGVATCLVSNSWGDHYLRDGWDVCFDAVVISGEVGMRKPEPRIFHHALGLVGLSPGDCVFIDDIEANIIAARALGMIGLHHRDPDATITTLETLSRLKLRLD